MQHSFLMDLDENGRAEATKKLQTWREKRITAIAMPGEQVGGERWHDALAMTGADRLVEKRPLYDNFGHFVPSHMATYHEGGEQSLGVVGAGWGLVQNADAFEGFQSLVESNAVTLEAIDQKDGGAVTTLTGLMGFSKINHEATIAMQGADVIAHFVRVSNGFTGLDAISFEAYTLRILCLNGMTSTTHTHNIRIKHTKNAAARVSQSHGAIAQLIDAGRQEAETFQELAGQPMDATQFVEFTSELIEDTRGAADTVRKQTRRENEIVELLEYFQHGQGNHGASRFDAYNAITEWLTPRQDQYQDAAKFARDFRNNAGEGTSARTRARAMNLLTR